MADLTAPLNNGDRLISCYDQVNEYAVANGVQIYQGAGVGLNASGLIDNVSAAGVVRTLGRAKKTILGDGSTTLKVDQGIFNYGNSGTNPIAAADRFKACYWEDNQTVSLSPAAGLYAGRVYDVDALGVKVLMMPESRSGRIVLTLRATDLVAGDAASYGLPIPFAGRISKIKSALLAHALAAGNAVLTGKINGTGITGGVITIPQASAVGAVVAVAPTALNIVAENDYVQFDVSGANTNTAAMAEITIELTPL